MSRRQNEINNSSRKRKADLNEVNIKSELLISNDLNRKEIDSKIQIFECDRSLRIKDQELDCYEEKNVEMIDMPDGEIEETILPDNDRGTDTMNTLPMKTENARKKEILERTDNYPETPAMEPVMSVELAATANILVTPVRKDNFDPLISSFEATDYKITIPPPIEGQKIVEDATEKIIVEDDDDDVQIIESRESPINIDSDTDDEKIKDLEEEAVPITVLYKPNFKQTARKSTTHSAFRILSFEARKQMIENITLATGTFSNGKTIEKRDIQSNQKNTRNNNESVNRENAANVNTKSINAKPSSINSADAHVSNANINETSGNAINRNKAKSSDNDMGENLSNNKKRKSNVNITNVNIIKAGTSNINSENKTNVNNINENSSNNNSAAASASTVNDNSNGDGKPPLTFVAQLDRNHTVIIPNAFYASQQYGSKPAFNEHKKITTDLGELVEQQVEWHMRRWLRNFYKHFISPQSAATSFSLLLLQQVVPIAIYNAIRNRKCILNSLPLNSDKDFDENLKDLMHNVFYLDKDEEKLTSIARQFCVLSCSFSDGQTMPLTIDINDGHTTSSTYQAQSDILQTMCPAIESTEKEQQQQQDVAITTTETTKTTNKTITSMSIISMSRDLLKQKQKQEEEKENPVTNSKQNERTTSVDLNNEKFALQVQRQDELAILTKMAPTSYKSFESVFIKTFFRNTHGSKTNEKVLDENIQKFKNYAQINKATTTAPTTTANSSTGDFEEMLVPNVLTASTNRVYVTVRQVAPRKPKQNKQKGSLDNDNQEDESKESMSVNSPAVKCAAEEVCRVTESTKPAEQPEEEETRLEEQDEKVEEKEKVSEIITCDSNDSDNVQVVEQIQEKSKLMDVKNTQMQLQPQQPEPSQLSFTVPLNSDSSLCVDSVAAQTCVLCQQRAPDMVKHYVNEHANTEVYISRLSLRQLALLVTREYSTIARLHFYVNGQIQYEASCIFCEKRARLTITHWHQHFTKHTGEYAYRCSGCQVRTLTRGEMALHIALRCSQYGRLLPESTPEADLARIEAYLCTLCHFVQLKPSSVVEHLIRQHNVQNGLPEHIQMITLIKFSQPVVKEQSTRASKPIAGTVIHNENVNECEKNDGEEEEAAANNTTNVAKVEDDDDAGLEVKGNVVLKEERNDDQQAIEGEMDVEEFQWIKK